METVYQKMITRSALLEKKSRMNVFDIRKEVRKVGLNYGMPCYFIECGPGISYKNEALARKLTDLGLRKGQLVVISDGLGEQGVGTFVKGLRFAGADVEIEADGNDTTPGWFPDASCWVVEWNGGKKFNFGSLRRGLDLLVYKGEDIEAFLKEAKDIRIAKAVVRKSMSLEDVFRYGIRFYKEE